MDEAKRQIRLEILNTLDNHCCGCQLKKEFVLRSGKQSVEQLCINECCVAQKLQLLGKKLEDKSDIRKNWTKEETIYLMKHVPILGIEKVAERLFVTADKVKIKYDYELTKTKKKTPHMAV